MESVQVKIFGQTYGIKGVADAGYIKTLAAFVDERMSEVQKATGTVDSGRVAILAALNISDELHRLRDQHLALEQSAGGAADRILQLTDSPAEETT